MTKDELNNKYFEWMYQLVSDRKHIGDLSYRKLLSYLHGVDFTYSLRMDSNRESDGINLRYRFGHEHSYKEPIIASYLDDRPCSVLEMMVSLSIRCEEHIMDDPEIGNRTGEWFWGMIHNLGLYCLSDRNFEKGYVDAVISKLLNRQYDEDGTGGLFTVQNCKYDLRTTDIWYQMCWYLNEVI
ncbi:hypothetical protein FACS189490_11330 [Clostridia bacterium]|nr:hypothetical protein FACS189490_11330 [Clostridia bacterium]